MEIKNYEVISKEDAIKKCMDEYVYLREKKTGDIYRLKIEIDEYAESPRKWDNICTIFSKTGNWNISDEGYSYTTREEIQTKYSKYEERANKKEIYMRPVFMYDHSGQTISLTPFGDPWDSGIAGYIFVEKEKIMKEYVGATEENWEKIADRVMQTEIEIYDAWITGEVYGYTLEKADIISHKRKSDGKTWETTEWETVDSCGGYYGYDQISEIFDQAIGNCYDYIKINKEEVLI